MFLSIINIGKRRRDGCFISTRLELNLGTKNATGLEGGVCKNVHPQVVRKDQVNRDVAAVRRDPKRIEGPTVVRERLALRRLLQTEQEALDQAVPAVGTRD